MFGRLQFMDEYTSTLRSALPCPMDDLVSGVYAPISERTIPDPVSPAVVTGVGGLLFPGVQAATERIADLTAEVSASLPIINETSLLFGDAARSVTTLASEFTATMQALRSLLEQIPAVRPFIDRVLTAAGILYDLVIAIVKNCFYLIPSLVLRIMQLFGVSDLVVRVLISNLVRTQCSNQSAQDTANMQNHAGLLELAHVAVGMAFLGREPSLNEMKYVNEGLRLKQGIMKEVASSGDMIMTFLRMLPEEITLWLRLVMPVRWWYSIFEPGSRYYVWINAVNELMPHEITARAAYDQHVQREVIRLYREGQQLLQEATALSAGEPRVYRLLETTFKRMDELYHIVDMSALCRTARPVPFVIYLFGHSGQGKSFIASLLPAILAGAPPTEPNLSYARNAAVAHWDGYTGQFAVQYDDYGAVRAANVQPGENAELMMIVSNEQMQLPMASLSDKGEVFRSPVVIMTSNVAYNAPNEIVDREALHRRRHVFVEVAVRPEFRNPRGFIDPNNIPADNSHWTFTPLDPVDEHAPAGEAMSYVEFIRHVKDSYAAHRESQRNALVNHERMAMDAYLAQMDNHALIDDLQNLTRVANTGLGNRGSHRENIGDITRAAMGSYLSDEDTPGWVKCVAGLVPLLVVFGSSYVMYQLFKKAGSEVTTRTKAVVKSIPSAYHTLSEMLRSERVQRMDSEGRWANLYGKMKGMTPELVEVWDKGCEEHPIFSALTDEEVETVIERTLADPKIRRFMKTEGAYTGKHSPVKAAHIVQLMSTEGSIDNNALEVVQNRIIPHLARVSWVTKTNHLRTCAVFFFHERLVLMPYHMVLEMDASVMADGTVLHFTYQDLTYSEIWSKERYLRIGRDAIVFQCSANVPNVKSTLNQFVNDADLDFAKKFEGAMITALSGGLPYMQRSRVPVTGNITEAIAYWDKELEASIPATASFSQLPVGDDVLYHRVRVMQAWEYKVDSQPGYCGGLLVAFHPSMMRKIVGMHIQGRSDGRAIAQHITFEMLNKAVNHFRANAIPPVCKLEVPFDACVGDALVSVHGSLKTVARLTPGLYLNDRTKLVPSLLHGKMFKPETAPSVMSPHDPRNLKGSRPLQDGINKYAAPAPIIDVNTLKKVSNHLRFTLAKMLPTIDRRVLTEHEALNGIPGEEFLDGIRLDTSAGFPYVKETPASGKTGVLSGALINHSVAVSHPLLRKNLDLRWTRALEGKRVPSVWVDCLKDERRPIEKIMDGKTRVFTIPPVDFTIIARRLFSAFNQAFYRSRVESFSAVGINPESSEWGDVYRRLRSVSMFGFAGDYSSWDGNICGAVMLEVCHLINQWYDDDVKYQLARQVIFEELISTVQVAGDLVYLSNHGNPSGNPFTSILNTIANAIYLRYVWLRLAPPLERNLVSFDTHVRDFIYGDDNILAVTPIALNWYSPDKVSSEMESIGMIYTSANKKGRAAVQPIGELTFLKRGFRDDGLNIYPVMEMRTIQELFNWAHLSKHTTLEEATVENVNNAFYFLYHRGKDIFDIFRAKLQLVASPDLMMKIFDYSYYTALFMPHFNDSSLEVMQNHAGESSAIARGSTAPRRDEDDSRSVINTQGIISVSQRATELSSPSEKHLHGSGLARGSITDPPWTLQKMVSKRIWLASYQWSTSSSPLTTLVRLRTPTDLLEAYFQVAPFERFTYFRGGVRFHIHINGMRQHLGLLMAYFQPLVSPDVTPVDIELNPGGAFSLNPVFLDPATDPEGVVDVPFYNIRNFILPNATYNAAIDFTGTFIIQVLVPLHAADGSPNTIDFNVWIEFVEDAEFHVPLHSGAVSRRFFNEKHKQIYTRMPAIREEVVSTLARSRMQNHGNTINNTTSIKAMGNIDGTTIPQNLKGDDFSGIGSGNSATPFDRPGRTWNPINIARKFIQNYTNTTGSELVTRLDLDPSNLKIASPEHFSTQQDEMDMAFLLHKPTWLDTIGWPASATPGTSLRSQFLGPMSTQFQDGSETQFNLADNTSVRLALYEFITKDFGFWRGGLRFRFHFVCSAFHSGRIVFSLNYGAPPDSSTGLRDATSQYAYEMDLKNEKKVFELDVPFVAPTMWMDVCHGGRSHSDPFAWWSKYFLGSWSLRVVNQLVTVSTAPPDIYIVISTSGASDYEVYYPSQHNSSFYPGTITSSGGVPSGVGVMQNHAGTEKNEGALAGEDAAINPPIARTEEVAAPEIVPPGHGPLQLKNIHFGNTAPITNLREVLRRYTRLLGISQYPQYVVPNDIDGTVNDVKSGFCQLDAIDTTVPKLGQRLFLAYAVLPVGPGSLVFEPTGTSGLYRCPWKDPMSLYSTMYRVWSGSIRYKVFFGPITSIHGEPGTDYTAGQYVPSPYEYPQGQSTVVFVPQNALGIGSFSPSYTGMNLAALATTLAHNTFAESGNRSALTPLQPVSCMLASDRADPRTIPYCEVEVPFTSKYNALYNDSHCVTSEERLAEYHYPGYLFCMTKFWAPVIDLPDIYALANIRWDINIYRAAGDDFRFGIFTGMPNVYAHGAPNKHNFGDTWVFTAPSGHTRRAEEQKKRKEEEKEPGFEVIPSSPQSSAMYNHSSWLAWLRKPAECDIQNMVYKQEIVSVNNKGPSAIKDDLVVFMEHLQDLLMVDGKYRTHREIYNDLIDHGLEVDVTTEWSNAVQETRVVLSWRFKQHPTLNGTYNALQMACEHTTCTTVVKCVEAVYNVITVTLLCNKSQPADVRAFEDTRTSAELHLKFLDDAVMENHASYKAVDEVLSTYNILKPTIENLTTKIEYFARKTESSEMNYRAAMNELCQQIETATYHHDVGPPTGPSHNPIFSANGVFSVQCEVYDGAKGQGMAQNKTGALEMCAQEVFCKLVDIAEKQRVIFNKQSEVIVKQFKSLSLATGSIAEGDDQNALKLVSEEDRQTLRDFAVWFAGKDKDDSQHLLSIPNLLIEEIEDFLDAAGNAYVLLKTARLERYLGYAGFMIDLNILKFSLHSLEPTKLTAGLYHVGSGNIVCSTTNWFTDEVSVVGLGTLQKIELTIRQLLLEFLQKCRPNIYGIASDITSLY